MRTLRRLLSIFGVFWLYGVAPKLTRSRLRGPVRLRMALERLGGAWVKLGQALALRFDLLPNDYCVELFKLLNKLAPFPYSDVEQIIVKELGAKPEEIFASFNPVPFAAASLGQVHRADLKDGTRVAVKVQRPHARANMFSDIRLMYWSSWIIDATRLLGRTRSRRLIEEFARWTNEELDYRVEARHGFYLGQNARDAEIEKDAKVFWRFTSEHVLTTEFLEGFVVADIIDALNNPNSEEKDRWKQNRIDPKRLAKHICWNFLNQVYLIGYFHADLHPANLLALPGNAIGYVDFGITGRLSPDVRESLAHYAWNLFDGKVDRSVTEFMRWVSATESTDLEAAKQDFSTIFDEYRIALDIPASRRQANEISQFEIRILETIRRHAMTIAPQLSMYFKAVVTVNAVVFGLDPEFDLATLEVTFFHKLIESTARSWLDPTHIAAAAFDASYSLQRWFGAIAPFEELGRDLTEVADSVRGRVQLLAIAAIIVTIIILVFALGPWKFLSSAAGVKIAYGVVGLLVVITLAIVYQSRRLPRRERAPTSRQVMERRKPT